MSNWPPDITEALWWGVRTIPMTPAPELAYNPILLIRAGEKTHTVRGQPRRPGTIAQVTVRGKRIPLWVRFTKSEVISHERMMTDEFAYADGFRPPPWGLTPWQPSVTPVECLRRFAELHCPRMLEYGARLYLLHFEVVRDEMDDTHETRRKG